MIPKLKCIIAALSVAVAACPSLCGSIVTNSADPLVTSIVGGYAGASWGDLALVDSDGGFTEATDAVYFSRNAAVKIATSHAEGDASLGRVRVSGDARNNANEWAVSVTRAELIYSLKISNPSFNFVQLPVDFVLRNLHITGGCAHPWRSAAHDESSLVARRLQ